MKKHYFTLIAFLFLVVVNAQIVNIPDPVFKAKLLSASSSNQIASTQIPVLNSNGTWTVSAYNTIDTNNDGDIQQSEALAITLIDVNSSYISSLIGIENFTNLQYIECPHNALYDIDTNVSGLTNLKYLNCSSSLLTSLNVSSLTNLKTLACGFNSISSINIQGLTNLKYLYTRNNYQLSSLNVQGFTNLIHLDCSNNGLTSLNVQGLTNLQILDCNYNQIPSLNLQGFTNLLNLRCYSNQLSSLNVQGLTNLKYLSCGSNQLPSLNVQGLTNLLDLECSSNQLSSLNVQGLTNLRNLNCSNNLLTSLNLIGQKNINTLNCDNNLLTYLSVKNGNNSDWLNLSFNQNQNLTYICADEQDIDFVQYKINQYGYSSTCHVNSYCSFTPGSTFYSIQVNNKLDSNTNGCDVSDPVYPYLKYNITNGSVLGSFIFNNLGNYSIPVSAGTYTISPQFENSNYFSSSPTSAIVNFPNSTSPFVQNFCIAANLYHDLEVVIIPIDDARPGFDVTYKIKYKNKGNQTENATVNFTYNDAILDYVIANVAPTTQATGTLSWNVGTLAPFQSGEIMVTLNVNSPMETPAVNGGDVLSYTATVNGLNTDETPDDNTFTLSQQVFNSFDPNDKTCLEGNVINPSMIGKYVYYKIRFENTGTFAAQNIVVKDMIDTAKFDIATLQMTDASHSCVTKISNTNKVEFIFENINLPFDDANNDGYVVFKIKTKPTLTLNSTISNLANIYFDYNFPIVTNTATSTFTTLGNDTFEFDTNFTIYPNPVAETLSLQAKQNTKILSLSIYTPLGQLVQTVINPTSSLDVAALKTGTYFVKITSDKGVSSSKFVKE